MTASVLDFLQRYLGTPVATEAEGHSGIMEMPSSGMTPSIQSALERILAGQNTPPPVPAGLPDAVVRREFLGGRSVPISASGVDLEGEPVMPAGLPDAVLRSILQQPSYGEGALAGPRAYSPSLRQEERTRPELGREWPLLDALTSEPGKGPGASYPSPLNQMFRRLPGMGLY